jgi:hypothetical protein
MEQFLHSNEFLITIATMAIAGGFYAFRKQIISAAKAAGKACGLFLKRFGLNDEVEQVGQAFVDGMKETNFSPVDTAKLKADIEKKYPAPQIEPDKRG